MNWTKTKRQNELTIQEYIKSDLREEEILRQDKGLMAARYFSSYADGMFGWYPFKDNLSMLQVGSWYGAYSRMLAERTRKLYIYESDDARLESTKQRLKDIDNISYIDTLDNAEEKFDYVLWAVDECHDVIPNRDTYLSIFKKIQPLLNEKGHILFAVPNRLGMKYLSGTPDMSTGNPFDGITEDSDLYRFDKNDLSDMTASLGFDNVKWYYPASELAFTQMVYTDSALPGNEIKDRLFICHPYKEKEFLLQERLLDYVIANDLFKVMCNDFIVELTNDNTSGVLYAALSTERDKQSSFSTAILTENRVIKRPIYRDGQSGIDRLISNHNDLIKNGINALELEDNGGYIQMDYESAPTLSAYIKGLIQQGSSEYVIILDRLWELILKSSGQVEPSKNILRDRVQTDNWGPILERAFIEMIPVNCFYKDGELEFFDQEYTLDNIPAKFVLFRAIKDTYHFSKEAEYIVPLSEIKEKYGLKDLWQCFMGFEEEFQDKLRRRHIYTGYWEWKKALPSVIKANRNSNKKYAVGYVAGVYDLFHVGHVKLFWRAKQQCDYLIVGVLSDESVYEKKNKYPIIPCEQRVQMLESCKYVDRVVVLPSNDTSIHKAWELYRFDCMFTGDDHINDPKWIKEKEFLESMGSGLVFLKYSEETSSTQIREQLSKT